MASIKIKPTPVTILTGFLGAGKTTLILNLIPQLPSKYKLALLKNELGDLAIDSKLASSVSITSVRELLNGCICCNLVGQLSDALRELRAERNPDRIIIETSGSAFPATLAMEVNRLAREANEFVLDGVVSVIDVENWKGYEDTSVTAKMQARYTDLVIFNKWEEVSERRFDECLDRLGDLEANTPFIKSDKGGVKADVLLGIDGALARDLFNGKGDQKAKHSHIHSDVAHQKEVDVLSVILESTTPAASVDVLKLNQLLQRALKDEVYRMKAILTSKTLPSSFTPGEVEDHQAITTKDTLHHHILNWAFGRWTYTAVDSGPTDAVMRMTIILAKFEAPKWKKRIEHEQLIALDNSASASSQLRVDIIS